jgi:ABC-type polysaccharide/polyol phosphate export permease
MVHIFRAPIYEGTLPAWDELAVAGLIAFVTLYIGWWFFTKKADDFAYRA